MTTIDEILEASLNEAKRIVEKEVLGQRLQETVYLVNTAKGIRAYHRYAKEAPAINAEHSRGAEYGRLEEHEGQYFIFLNSILADNLVDLIPTLIHEILHIIWPQANEKKVWDAEREICRNNGIENQRVFRNLSP